MKPTTLFLVVSVLLSALVVTSTSGMGLCFGGGYPRCCANGKNACGPLCASCSRVNEYLMNMHMFAMMGMGMGTPDVFRIINGDPFARPNTRPFPAQPFPTNFLMNGGGSRRRR